MVPTRFCWNQTRGSWAPLRGWAAILALLTALCAGAAYAGGGQFQVNTSLAGRQFVPAVAMDPQGNSVVVWTGPSVSGVGRNNVFGQRYDAAGAPQGSEFLVDTLPHVQSMDSSISPDVAMDSQGNFVVVWQSGHRDDPLWGIHGQRFNAAGVAQGPEFRVNTYTENAQTMPAVAMDGQGDFVVVWQSYQQDGNEDGIYGQRFNASGAPQGTEFRVNTWWQNSQDSADVAMDSAGNFVVVWQSQNQDGDPQFSSLGIFGQRYSASGQVLGPEFQVNTYWRGAQARPSVGMDGAGNFLAAWQSNPGDGLGSGIYAQRYQATGAQEGSEFRVSGATAGGRATPDVAVSSNGSATVLWHSLNQDGSGWGVYGQRYDAAGAALGAEFRVNTVTAQDQLFPVAAMNDAGAVLVAWQSGPSDESDIDVCASLLQPNDPTGLRATPNLGPLRVELAWNDVQNEERYDVYRGVNGGAETLAGSVGADVTAFTDTDVALATTYTYRILAWSSGGADSYSWTVSAITPTPPVAPTGLTATAVSEEEISLSWTHNGANTTRFEVYRRPEGGDYSLAGSVNPPAVSFRDPGLAPNTSYSYFVRAVGVLNADSAEISKSTLAVPAAPTNLQATLYSTLYGPVVILTWEEPDPLAKEFHLERKSDTVGWAEIAVVEGKYNSVYDRKIAPGTHYTYRARAFGVVRFSSYSNEAEVTLRPAPAAPTGLNATTVSEEEIRLSWTHDGANTDRFYVFHRPAGGAYAYVGTVIPPATTFRDTGLTPNTTYSYHVLAVGVVDVDSAEISKSTLAVPAVPANLQAVFSGTLVRLTWEETDANAREFRLERKTDSTAFAEIAAVGSGIRTYEDASAAPNTHYVYRVRAFGVVRFSGYSNEADATTPPPPAAPTGLNATTVSEEEIGLSWTHDGVNVARYEVYHRPAGGDYALAGAVAPPAVTFRDTGLTPNTAYTYFVRAVGSANADSGETSGSTLPLPAAPANLQTAVFSGGLVRLTWEESDPFAREFHLERKSDTTGWAEIGVVGSGIRTYEDRSVSPATHHTYRVRAFGVARFSGYSNEAEATTQAAPAPPTGLNAQATSSTQIKLTWTAGGTGQNDFRIERKSGGAGFAELTRVRGTVTAYIDGGLTPGTTYTYQVRAASFGALSAPSNPASDTAWAAPPAPAGLNAVPTSTTQIKLTWSDRGATETAFRVERKSGAGGYVEIKVLAPNTNSYTDGGLTAGTAYTYRVRASSGTFYSAYTNEASATPPSMPLAPGNLAAACYSATQIKLTWADRSDNEDGFKVERKTSSGSYNPVATLGANVTAYIDGNLTPNTSYTYVVRAFSSMVSSANAGPATGTTFTVPAAPTALRAEALSSTQIKLTWTDGSSTETSFRVERQKTDGSWEEIKVLAANSAAYVDAGRTAGTPYVYRVRAASGTVFSPYSNTASASP
jgi:titin